MRISEQGAQKLCFCEERCLCSTMSRKVSILPLESQPGQNVSWLSYRTSSEYYVVDAQNQLKFNAVYNDRLTPGVLLILVLTVNQPCSWWLSTIHLSSCLMPFQKSISRITSISNGGPVFTYMGSIGGKVAGSMRRRVKNCSLKCAVSESLYSLITLLI